MDVHFFYQAKSFHGRGPKVLLCQTFLLSFCLFFWLRLEDPDSRILTHTPISYPSKDCFPLALLENNNKVHWPSSLDLSPNMPYHQGFYAIFTLISPFFLLLFFYMVAPSKANFLVPPLLIMNIRWLDVILIYTKCLNKGHLQN